MGQLEENERLIVREMLRQEAGAFARHNDDVGCVENLELEIQLKDNEPVREEELYLHPQAILWGSQGVLRRPD